MATQKWETIKHNASQAMTLYVGCALDDAKERVSI